MSEATKQKLVRIPDYILNFAQENANRIAYETNSNSKPSANQYIVNLMIDQMMLNGVNNKKMLDTLMNELNEDEVKEMYFRIKLNQEKSNKLISDNDFHRY